MPLLQPELLKRSASLSRVTGEKGREFLLRADTVSRASGVRPPQGHPVESGPLPRDMVLLQHIIIVLRLLLSCFMTVRCLCCHSSVCQPSVKEKRERQDRFYYNTPLGPLGPLVRHRLKMIVIELDSKMKRKPRSSRLHTDSIRICKRLQPFICISLVNV